MSYLQAVIDRFENNRAVLLFPDGQELIVDKKYLPEKLKAGIWLKVDFKVAKGLTRKKRKRAEELLSKVFKNEQEKEKK